MGKVLLSVVIIVSLLIVHAAAHPGRTDGSGGHWNHSIGEYHYHHGQPEHQHPNGECPYDYEYDYSDSTGNNINSNNTGSSHKPSPAPSTNDRSEKEKITIGKVLGVIGKSILVLFVSWIYLGYFIVAIVEWFIGLFKKLFKRK